MMKTVRMNLGYTTTEWWVSITSRRSQHKVSKYQPNRVYLKIIRQKIVLARSLRLIKVIKLLKISIRLVKIRMNHLPLVAKKNLITKLRIKLITLQQMMKPRILLLSKGITKQLLLHRWKIKHYMLFKSRLVKTK